MKNHNFCVAAIDLKAFADMFLLFNLYVFACKLKSDFRTIKNLH